MDIIILLEIYATELFFRLKKIRGGERCVSKKFRFRCINLPVQIGLILSQGFIDADHYQIKFRYRYLAFDLTVLSYGQTCGTDWNPVHSHF